MTYDAKLGTRSGKWRRRHLLGAAVGGMALVLGGSFNASIAQQGPFAGTKLTYWAGLIAADGANELLVNTIRAWGEANGVETEVVLVNADELPLRISAAVESRTMPDALDLGGDLLLRLSRQGILAMIDDLYESVGAAQGGWYEVFDIATDTTGIAGGRTGLPYGASGQLLLRRTDLLGAAGLTQAPATWQELSEQAAAVTTSSVFGLGLALSNVGDGNVQVSVLQSFGGRIADDAGTKVTIKSEETRAYLTWVKDAWGKGIFPPGVAAWDAGGDNQAYLSGQAAFVVNTGSIGIFAKQQDPELYDVTAYSSLPAGPIGTISPVTPWVRAVSATSNNQDAAKALLEYLSQPEFMSAYYASAVFGPVLKNQAAFAAFNGDDPIQAGRLDLVEKGTAPGYPDVFNSAYADVFSNYIVPKMVQRVIIDGWDLDRAMDEAQAQAEAIYSRY